MEKKDHCKKKFKEIRGQNVRRIIYMDTLLRIRTEKLHTNNQKSSKYEERWCQEVGDLYIHVCMYVCMYVYTHTQKGQ